MKRKSHFSDHLATNQVVRRITSARTESPTGAFVKESKRMKFDIVGDVHGQYYSWSAS